MCFGRVVAGDQFDEFLQSLAQELSLGNRRFIARNFLLDEGVCSERETTYERAGVMRRHADLNDWQEMHGKYLFSEVYLRRPHPMPTQIDRTDENNCPETFRHQIAFRDFGAVDIGLDIIRVQDIPLRLVRRAGFDSVDELTDLARNVLADPFAISLIQRLDSALELWTRSLDLRPMWAGFWEDLWDLFGPDTSRDSPEWANELRDRFGLYHLNPAMRSAVEIPIFVFRYPVRILPYLRGERDLRPIAIPTVLDGQFNEAFCPAPKDEPCGFTLYLGKQGGTLRREFLHPSVQFQAQHLFRVGTVTSPVPADLSDARAQHLQRICVEASRGDYANITDGDLL